MVACSVTFPTLGFAKMLHGKFVYFSSSATWILLLMIWFKGFMLATSFKRLDAAFYHPEENSSYIFQRDKVTIYDRKHGHNIFKEELLIKEVFPNAPTNIESALFTAWKKVLLYKDAMRWKYDIGKIVTLYGKSIHPSGIYEGHPLRPGAAVFYTYRRIFGYFEGDLYWRTADNDLNIKIGYPRPIREEFKDSPTHIDAALSMDGVTYIFKDGFTWRWTLPSKLDPGYPQPFNGGFADPVNVHSVQAMDTDLSMLKSYSDITMAKKRLIGHVVITVHATSLQHCFEECLKLKPMHCLSFNIEMKKDVYTNTHLCELNDSKKELDMGKFIQHEAFIYYYIIQ